MQCKNTLFRWRGQILHSFISVEPMSLHFFLRGRGIFVTLSLLSQFKQHVVFSKTTRCFQQNDTLFSVKRHVVFFTESCIAARRFCHSLPTAS